MANEIEVIGARAVTEKRKADAKRFIRNVTKKIHPPAGERKPAGDFCGHKRKTKPANATT